MNRILAIVWSIIAVLDFGWAWTNPETHRTLGGTGISLGWVAAFLAFYNVVRWWGSRLAASEKTPATAPVGRRRARVNDPAPDPNLNFTDPAASTGLTKSDGKS